MKKENVKKWVDALRSGNYNQGKHRLRGEDGYCCLGVACEVAKSNGVPLALDVHRVSGPSYTGLEYSYDKCVDMLPMSVQKWLGLVSEDGAYYNQDGDTVGSLAELNDGGMSFENIADIIEKESSLFNG